MQNHPTGRRPRTLVATLVALALLAAGGGALARSYTMRDIDSMRGRYEKERQASSAAEFPSETIREPWREPVATPCLLPYQAWEPEYRAFFTRHVGDARLDLAPRILVMHYTVTESAAAALRLWTRGVNMAAGDQGTVFGHPSVHYVIDRDGTIYQTFPTERRCTGTYGVNHVALQVELVAMDEGELLRNRTLVSQSFRLARSLLGRFSIPPGKVYGHYEVGQGRSVVPEYLDLADTRYPDRYPSSSTRTDPGTTYMAWLRAYLGATVSGGGRR